MGYLAILVLSSVANAGAQLPAASAGSLGLGENYVALAEGFDAVAWNPAALADRTVAASFTIIAVRGLAGLGPITLGDISDYEGTDVPESVRRQWLDRITGAGGEQGAVGMGLTYLAAQWGPVATHFATTASVRGNVSPDAGELILFGNAGRTGDPADLFLEGSFADISISSTMAMSYGHSIPMGADHTLDAGVTLKATRGHFLVSGFDLGSQVTTEPHEVRLAFPIIQSDTIVRLGRMNRGTGVGLDLGVRWRQREFTAAASLHNVFNTFAWNDAGMFFRPGTVEANGDEAVADFVIRPFTEAPAEVRARLRRTTYAPTLAAGVAYQLRPDLVLTSDIRRRFGQSLEMEPATHAGVGAEYRPLVQLPLRAGASLNSGGYLLAAGAGIDFGVIRLDFGFGRRQTGLGTETLGMVNFSSISRR